MATDAEILKSTDRTDGTVRLYIALMFDVILIDILPPHLVGALWSIGNRVKRQSNLITEPDRFAHGFLLVYLQRSSSSETAPSSTIDEREDLHERGISTSSGKPWLRRASLELEINRILKQIFTETGPVLAEPAGARNQ